MLAVVAAIAGMYGLLGALALLTVGGTALGGWTGAIFAAGLVALGYAALSLLLAYGLWDLRPWAWGLGLAVQALGAIQVLLRWAGGRASLPEVVIGIALSAAIAWYLLRAEVREVFRTA